MKTDRLDHLVLTVRSIDDTLDFYQRIMGMGKVTFGEGRVALTFGNQKINLHESGNEFEPKASQVRPGSADLCFILQTPVHEALNTLSAHGVPVIEGPVSRTGATGEIKHYPRQCLIQGYVGMPVATNTAFIADGTV